VLVAKYKRQLEQLGLTTVQAVKRCAGELVKDHHGRRDILRLCVSEADGPLILYVKRNWKPYRKDGLRSLLLRGRVCSLSRQEWENSRALAAVGLRTAELVACGEECGLLWEKFSFIITRSAEGSATLERFLETCTDRAVRRRVLDSLAGEVRRMHEAGLSTPDLFTRHVFVDSDADPPQFCLIDMARLERRRRVPDRVRARDLAALNITAPLRHVSARERIRFLRAYAGGMDRGFIDRIRRRMEHLLKRRKFRAFCG
jgi:heptose I phosphotransferase